MRGIGADRSTPTQRTTGICMSHGGHCYLGKSLTPAHINLHTILHNLQEVWVKKTISEVSWSHPVCKWWETRSI